MATIAPLTQNYPVVDEQLRLTREFKGHMDALLNRVGWITGGKYGQLAEAATIVWDVDRTPCAFVVLTGNRTLADPVNAVRGHLWPYRLTVIQDNVGSRTLTWGGGYRFAGGTPVTLSTAANAVDEFWFSYDGFTKVVAGGLNFS